MWAGTGGAFLIRAKATFVAGVAWAAETEAVVGGASSKEEGKGAEVVEVAAVAVVAAAVAGAAAPVGTRFCTTEVPV